MLGYMRALCIALIVIGAARVATADTTATTSMRRRHLQLGPRVRAGKALLI